MTCNYLGISLPHSLSLSRFEIVYVFPGHVRYLFWLFSFVSVILSKIVKIKLNARRKTLTRPTNPTQTLCALYTSEFFTLFGSKQIPALYGQRRFRKLSTYKQETCVVTWEPSCAIGITQDDQKTQSR